MENEQVYIIEQEEKLKAKLTLADKVDQQIKLTQDSLEERFVLDSFTKDIETQYVCRKLIKQIGIDYTIQDKSFDEWLQKLLIKDE
jgi:hypothetical protein